MYLDECKTSSKPGYHSVQLYTINKHIRDYFEHADIKELHTMRSLNSENILLKKLSNKSVNNLLATLSQLFEKAINEDVIKKTLVAKLRDYL